jgi:hypothetical protein
MAIVELAVMSLLVTILLVTLGELTGAERRHAIDLVRRPRLPFTSSTRPLS